MNQNMEPNGQESNEDIIDLGLLARVMWKKKLRLAAIVALCVAISGLVVLFMPKQYASTTLLQLRNINETQTYIKLMKTHTILDDAISRVGWKGAAPDADALAQRLAIRNPKGTSFLEVVAKSGDPAEAQAIATAVVDSTRDYQAEHASQTVYVDALDEHIRQVKKDADEAAAKFLAYRRDHPGLAENGDIRLSTNRMDGYDNAAAELASKAEAAKAQRDGALEEITKELRENPERKDLCDQLVTAAADRAERVQASGEGSDDVAAADAKIAELERQLRKSIGSTMDADSATKGSRISGLAKAAAQAAIEADLAEVSRSAVLDQKKEDLVSLEGLSPDMETYLSLKSDAEMKAYLHRSLAEKRENGNIQKTVNATYLATVDAPNLPQPGSEVLPQKKPFLAAGAAIGLLLAFGYSLLLYRKEL